MTSQLHFARALRLRRLYRGHPAALMIVPLDHPVSDGPVVPVGGSLDRLAEQLAAGGADAIVVHKGCLRHLRPDRFANMSLIVHLSASTCQAPDPDDKYLVTGVEEAVRLGADAVSVHVNLGSHGEPRQIADLGAVAEACDRWNLPLMAMMYPRGPSVSDPYDPGLIAHAAIVAAELGADLAKVPYPGTVKDLRAVVASCPIPLVVAGGRPRATDAEVAAFVRDALAGGAGGVAMGRTVFQSAQPGRTATLIAGLVHDTPNGHLELNHLTGGQQRERAQVMLA